LELNHDFETIFAARDEEQRDLFLGVATKIGTAVQNVEKDFWVCWILDALFNGLDEGGPRLLFKGGTSLSKAFGLISRFSEDIDITVFRDDLGQATDMAELDALSGKQRRVRLDAIRNACQAYINGPLIEQLGKRAASVIPDKRFRLEADPDDADGQTLLFWYPAVTAKEGDYIRSAVKIEGGAKSALDPHISVTVTPYVAEEVSGLNLKVPHVVTVKPERTFWDKIIILHGLNRWYEHRGVLRHGGQRVSRHYYDVYRLLQSDSVAQWLADPVLAEDCARHARLFFGSPDLGLETARAGTFTLTPPVAMYDALRRDYEAMAQMIFGDVPALGDVLASIERVQATANA
jgi:hypothetical protein